MLLDPERGVNGVGFQDWGTVATSRPLTPALSPPLKAAGGEGAREFAREEAFIAGNW